MVWHIKAAAGGHYDVVAVNDFGVTHKCGTTDITLRMVEEFIFEHAQANDVVKYPDGRVHRVLPTALA